VHYLNFFYGKDAFLSFTTIARLGALFWNFFGGFLVIKQGGHVVAQALDKLEVVVDAEVGIVIAIDVVAIRVVNAEHFVQFGHFNKVAVAIDCRLNRAYVTCY